MSPKTLKTIQVGEITEKLWRWLRRLPEYQKDFKLQSELIKKGKIHPYNFVYTMSAKTRRKFNLLSNIIPTKKQKKLWSYFTIKWGFHPLQNPTNKQFPEELYSFLCSAFLKEPPLNKATKITNTLLPLINYYDEKLQHSLPLPKLPKKLLVEIDYYKPDEQIISEIRFNLRIFRTLYKINVARPQVDLLENQYKALILKHLGKPKKYLEKSLFSYIDDDDTRRKRLSRVLKKIP